MQQAKKKVAVKKKVHPLMRLLFDTHCHPQDDTCNVDLIPQLPVAGLCLIGVRDIDWCPPPPLLRFLFYNILITIYIFN
jgi:hypothetical protein